MKAVGLYHYLPITDEASLLDLEIDKPVAKGHDILVKIAALSVNPVDTKVRAPKDVVETSPRILGYDAAGVVVAVGELVSTFSVGDEVYYAGVINRSGSNAEYQLVDERIAAIKPATLSFAQAAALPLTTITAWEALFERLAISKNESSPKTLLIIGGAGGVGSVAIQLGKKIAGLTVLATASRPQSQQWCTAMGADEVLDHSKPLAPQLAEAGHAMVDYILCCTAPDSYWETMVEVIKPQGKICGIVDNLAPLKLNLLKPKSATFVWEFMFTRPLFGTPDMIEQQRLLTEVARAVDAGTIVTTLTKEIAGLSAKNLKEAHTILESGTMIGKLVITL